MISTAGKCLIWGTPAKLGSIGDGLRVDSLRAGGKYRITGTAMEIIEGFSPDLRARLTWWLCEQRDQGESEPLISSTVVESVQTLSPPSITARRDRALEFLASRSPKIGTQLKIGGEGGEENTINQTGLQAWTGSQDSKEAAAFLSFLKDVGYVAGPDASSRYTISFSGWTYLEEQRARRTASLQAFVAM
jgi:hypothetical protein